MAHGTALRIHAPAQRRIGGDVSGDAQRASSSNVIDFPAGREPHGAPGSIKLAALDVATIRRDFGPDGPIAAVHERYEERDSQQAMACTVAQLYTDGGIGLLEAGTGVGKSLAYLVPALRWAAATDERTVVSTNTINLQEQLVRKDLPFLATALDDQPVRFALLKGWRNYLCLARLTHALDDAGSLFEPDVRDGLARIAQWAGRTEDGSLADLPAPPKPDIWDEVAAEPDLCTRQKCPHYTECFLFRARRAAAQADVVVVNHHLLMSDVAVRRAQQNWDEAAVIPAYTRLVIDEGHHLEEAAAAHLGASVSRRALQRLFGRLDRRGKGLLPTLVNRLGNANDLWAAKSLEIVSTDLIPLVDATRERAELVFDLLDTVLHEPDAPAQLRLSATFAKHRVWDGGLRAALDDLLRALALIDETLQFIRGRHMRAADRVVQSESDGEFRDDIQSDAASEDACAPLFAEIKGISRRLQAAAAALSLALAPPNDTEPMVRWIEIRGGRSGPSHATLPRGRNVAVSAVPLDLAPILREDLFCRVDTAVVTSATLTTTTRSAEEIPSESTDTTPGAFDFLIARLGVAAPDLTLVTDVYPSPFDYAAHALLAIPTDVVAPNIDPDRHLTTVVRIVRDVAAASDGGVFVLFTSHRDVRAAAAALRSGASSSDPCEHELLVHGEAARDLLLTSFRTSGRGILLGTASFWEGVDVPGAALRGLVIAKLPFRVPTEPVTAAQCEAIAARGGDAFVEYMLPHAALRLKQGFGRLIRSATDRGVVVIADPRVVTKPYGRILANALPPARRISGRWATLRTEIRTFY